MRNRWGWDRSKRLHCANLHTALVDYLRLGKRTQRETPAGSQPLSPRSAFLCLPGHSVKKDKFAQGSSPSLQPGLCLPLLNRGPTAGKQDWGLSEEKLACGGLPAREQPYDLRPVGTQAGHRLDAAQAWRLVPAQLGSAQKGNAIRSTWYFLEISESNPALTRRERSASHRRLC